MTLATSVKSPTPHSWRQSTPRTSQGRLSPLPLPTEGHALALSGIQADAESIAVPKTAMKAMAVIQTYRPSKRDASSE